MAKLEALDEATNNLFAACLGYYLMEERGIVLKTDDAVTSSIRGLLRKYMLAKAKGHKSALLEPSKEHPGYLRYDYPKLPVYFPWVIIDDLPDRHIINELIELCSKIKIGKFSTICLSGSSLYFGALRVVSDLDMLEYEVGNELDPKAVPAPDGFLLLNSKERYLEYVANSGFWGTIEITNKLVPIDYADVGIETKSKSFAYQEAPLVHIPRKLNDPIEVGRYIYFLADQSLSYMHNHPEKAAKRLLPLSRIMARHNISDAVRFAFDSSEVQSALRVRQKLDVLKKIAKFDATHELRESVLNEIETARGSLGEEALTVDERDRIDSLSAAIRHICLVNKDFLNGILVPK